jgi:PAS domain S-box-containing protein
VTVTLPQTIQVLHVDDEPDLAELTATFLEREDDRFSVETATSAKEGLDRIADGVPDCIVSDYNMPGTDGIEFLQAVRETNPDLPFLLYTGKGSEAVASDAISAGVTDYLQKQSGSEQYELLANRIRNAVRAQHEAERAARQEELIRLTELAGGAGGFELDHETGDILLTEGARRLTGLSGDEDHSLADVLALHRPGDRQQVRDDIDRVVETGQRTEETYRIQSADGDGRCLSIRMVPADSGDTTVRGAISDITERRQRRADLEQIETLFEHAQDSLFLIDVGEELTVERVNPAYEDSTGLSAADLRGQTPREILGARQGATAEKRYRECIEQRRPLQYHETLTFGEETTHWETRIAPVVIDDTVEYIAGSTRNVTEQRERKDALESERRFVQQALDTLEDLFYVLDVDGRLERWNDRVTTVTGYTDEELAGMAVTEMFPPEDREQITEALAAALAGDPLTAEADLRTADGTRVPYEFTGAPLTDPDGATTGIVGIGRDLRERRQRERRFQALVEESNDIISIVDSEGRYQYQSPSLERVLGYDPEETIGDEAWEYIHPDDRAAVREQFAEWVANPELSTVIQYRARDADGSWRWMEARGNNQFDNPAVEGYVVNSRDITEQKQRERELRATKQQYQTLAENFPDGAVYLFDRDLQFLRARGEELRSLGLSPEDIEGSTPHDLFPEEIADELADHFRVALAGTGSTFEQAYGGERYRIRTVPVSVEDPDGGIECGMAVAENVTEQARRREQLERQNERLEEFASIVSHDLRNPLQVARGRLELASDTTDSPHLADALDALDRSEALIDDLLTLAREGQQVDDLETVALDTLAEQAWQTVETSAATLDVATDRTIQADRSRLRQLFENLFANSVEHGGQDVTVTVEGLQDGFAVADSGPGIPDEARADVFEAGYSTSDGGTGFGLRIVDQVATNHGWTVHLTDGADGGARFEITGVDVVA